MGKRLTSNIITLALVGIAAVAGCTRDGTGKPTAQSKPLAKPRYTPPPDRVVTSTLLTFESPSDLAFVQQSLGSTAELRIESDPADPKNHALRIPDGGHGHVNVSALMRGREFPGPWDMIGFRFRKLSEPGLADVDLRRVVPNPGPLTIVSGSARMESPERLAGTWRTFWIPIGDAMHGAEPTSQMAYALAEYRLTCGSSGGGYLLDDIVLAQSNTVVAESLTPETGRRFQVRRVGYAWVIAWDHQVGVQEVAAPFVEDGYSLVEADPTRVLLQSPAAGTLAVNRLGRVIRNGKVIAEPKLGSNALADGGGAMRVEVIGTLVTDDGSRDDGNVGRVERTLSGDRDNDGYDETRGCAVVRAQGSRINVRLSSSGRPIKWPVLEVRDLPAGAVNVYVEGQTVPWTTRLADGRVIVELPITLADRVDVQVRVR